VLHRRSARRSAQDVTVSEIEMIDTRGRLRHDVVSPG
jgi:hypothetical protein